MRLSSFLFFVPLLIAPVIIYTLCTYTGALNIPLGDWQTIAGDQTVITSSMLITLLGSVCLLFELLKATTVGSRVMVDHTFSVLLLLGVTISYVVVPGFGTETFLLLVIFSLIDVIAGLVISQATARRDIGFGVG